MKKIKAFTMLEILVISILISVGLFAVRKAMDHAKRTNMRVMQSVIANQLATEGAEILYQTRNTNFLQYYYSENTEPEFINSCRLAYNYKNCENTQSHITVCEPSDYCGEAAGIVMQSGYYYIVNSGGKNIIKNCLCDTPSNCDDIRNNKYAICLNNGVRTPCPEGHEAGGDESKFGKFYRMIKGIGVYNMGQNTTGGLYEDSSFCMKNIDAQEFRFCSIVAWDGGQGGEVEICSTMTNFAELEGDIVR